MWAWIKNFPEQCFVIEVLMHKYYEFHLWIMETFKLSCIIYSFWKVHSSHRYSIFLYWCSEEKNQFDIKLVIAFRFVLVRQHLSLSLYNRMCSVKRTRRPMKNCVSIWMSNCTLHSWWTFRSGFSQIVKHDANAETATI